jgi:SpoVK/Ycf46/Vps4 family AAA+-type ATPase
MDNIKNIPEKVSVFATTNMPWELDIAALRIRTPRYSYLCQTKTQERKLWKLHSGTHHTLSE